MEKEGEKVLENLMVENLMVFEPFLNQEFKEEDLFVNNYGGNYAQNMQLNRSGVEQALKTAHLEGKVFLTTLAPSRSRAEAQGNELAAKRFLLFERKTQKVEEENPYKRVVSIPEGWRIEINDQRLTEELTERELTGEKPQRTFINRFNIQLKEALRECVWREKCSSDKDKRFRFKAISSATIPLGDFSLEAVIGTGNIDPFDVLGPSLISYALCNLFLRYIRRTNIDYPWEYPMPFVEIDKVGRTFAYLSIKDRKLVREVQKER